MMMTRYISLDLDDVLCEFVSLYLKVVNQVNGTCYQEENLTHYNTTLCRDSRGNRASQAHTETALRHIITSEIALSAQPKPTVLESLVKMKRRGWSLLVVSHRHYDFLDESLNRAFGQQAQKWLSKHCNGLIDHLEIVGNDQSKYDVCCRYGARIHVDDAIHHLRPFTLDPSMLPVLMSMPWNHNENAIPLSQIGAGCAQPGNLYRARTLQEVVAALNYEF